MKILLCTDEKFLLTSLEYRFRKNGWQLNVASEPADVNTALSKQKPDLIVLDLQKEGFEDLESLRNTWNSIPVLVGGPVEKGDLIMEAIEMGAQDFIVSPFKPDELVLRIHRLLNKQKVLD